MLATQLCGTPIGLLTLVDEERVWFKSNFGLPGRTETPRKRSPDERTIAGTELLEVPDITADKRFSDHPMMVSAKIQFYAGVPLITRDGCAVGTLCVMDRRPRTLAESQREGLRELATTAVEQLDARRANLRMMDAQRTELYHLDLANRRIVFASEGALRNLGYTTKEIYQLPLSKLLPATGDPTLWADFEKRLKQKREGPIVVTRKAVRKDGSTYPLELRIELIDFRDRELVVAIGTDLTEQKRAERRVKLLSTAIDNASDAVVIYEPVGPGQPSRIVYVNDALLQSVGYTRDELLGQTSAVFVGHSEDVALVDDVRRRAQAGETVRFRSKTRRKDGTTFWTEQVLRPLLDEEGRVANIVSIRRDVTRDVQFETALSRQNEILTALTSVARELFSTLEPRTLIEKLERGASVLCDATVRFWVAQPDGKLVRTGDMSAPDGAAAVDEGDAFLHRSLETDLVSIDDDERRAAARILRSSGPGWLLESVSPHGSQLPAGSIFALGLVAQYAAIALRNVELYAELDARRSAVVELNQQKADMIAMLAHDFKGPLTSIVGFAQLLEEDPKLDAKGRQFLETILQNGMRLANLATDTLELSQIEHSDFSLVRQPVDVGKLVMEIVETYRARRRIDMNVETATAISRGDAPRLRQVFENLIGNAIKYSPSGDPIEVAVRRKGDTITVSVKDRGIGIPTAELKNLFGRFARGSNARKLGITGTGFGLYISKTIVEKHGGVISATSIPDAGSTFTVQLQAASERDAEQRVARVLLIDPEGETRSFAAQALRGAALRLRVVQTIRDAHAILTDERFDVVVVDVLPSNEDALTKELFETIPSRLRREIAFVRIGGTGESALWDRAISKPFLSKDLVAAIEGARVRAEV
ncbi:MAG: PAS domain S-box protein [Candidatus Eremiobacteraeota bacterium]|nr:PAS domain S-box protein [Candidatus Eremiobacteraeota bacterium]